MKYSKLPSPSLVHHEYTTSEGLKVHGKCRHFTEKKAYESRYGYVKRKKKKTFSQFFGPLNIFFSTFFLSNCALP